MALRPLLSEYVSRLSAIAGNLINCAPVLNWLEVDNRGRRLFPPPPSDDADAEINTPAVAAAYAIRRYAAIASDEISFEVCPYIWPSPVRLGCVVKAEIGGNWFLPLIVASAKGRATVACLANSLGERVCRGASLIVDRPAPRSER